MKPTFYIKDGNGRMARYVTYLCRGWCSPAEYPYQIAYLQTCVDNIANTPAVLDVTITPAGAGCSAPIKYGRNSGFACDPAGTVIDPDCLPAGWTVSPAGSDPGNIYTTWNDISPIQLPLHVFTEWGLWGEPPCRRDHIIAGSTCPDAPAPCGNWMVQNHDCYRWTMTVDDGVVIFTHTWDYPAVGVHLSFGCVGNDEIYVVAWRSLGRQSGNDALIGGTGNNVALNADCQPVGTSVVPMYYTAECVGCGAKECMGCSENISTPINEPVYVGNLILTFARC